MAERERHALRVSGSFDPLTNGHIDIIQRSEAIRPRSRRAD